MTKDRVDKLVFKQGLCSSRESAQREIMAGNIFIGTKRINKPGEQYDVNTIFILKGDKLGYVSRGGLKLFKAIKEFKLSVEGQTCIDIGSSTGGFTDCLLQNNALFVYAIDVGTNQLDYSLRKRDDVKVYEKTNVKDLSVEMFDKLPTIAVCDVSFISLFHVFQSLKKLPSVTKFIALIKPQFEAGKEVVDKGKGVVNDKKIHIDVIKKIIDIASDSSFHLHDLTYSPITGKKEGNIEYLSYFSKESLEKSIDIDDTVLNAFKELK